MEQQVRIKNGVQNLSFYTSKCKIDSDNNVRIFISVPCDSCQPPHDYLVYNKSRRDGFFVQPVNTSKEMFVTNGVQNQTLQNSKYKIYSQNDARAKI